MTTISLTAFGVPGTTELIIIASVLVLFFGAKRVPELARSIGETINEIKKVTK